MARLRYGYVVKCTGCEKDASGKVTAVLCEYLPESRARRAPTTGQGQGQPGLRSRWRLYGCFTAEVRLYQRPPLRRGQPGAGRPPRGRCARTRARLPRRHQPEFQGSVITARLEPSLGREAGAVFQFERHGYFVADRVDSKAGGPVFNRTSHAGGSWAAKPGK